MVAKTYVLCEHAIGYGLFFIKEFEEIGADIPQVEETCSDLNKFKAMVRVSAFSPYKSSEAALMNINCLMEGILHEDLYTFLETNLPSKKSNLTLGVADAKLGQAINAQLGVKCAFTAPVPEILRGIRQYFHHMVSAISEDDGNKARVGLAHNVSRSRVKFNVNRADNLIIQGIKILDQLDKDVNQFAMRIREWYSYHFPELYKLVSDNQAFTKLMLCIGNRKTFLEECGEGAEKEAELLAKITEIIQDGDKTKEIYEAMKSSMGMDIAEADLANCIDFANEVLSLIEYRKETFNYVSNKMTDVAPNLKTLVGETVGARLISHAGSLTNLAKHPASTVQILGAEKALFRALKSRGKVNTPKYGLLFHSTFIGRARQKDKGRISRFLANKCSIASRIDCFAELPTTAFGEEMKEQVEERLKYYDNEEGEKPAKNIDVMRRASVKAEESRVATGKLEKKRKKKEKKERKKEKAANVDEEENNEGKKEKKMKRKLEEEVVAAAAESEQINEKKKKKKKNK